MKKNKTTLNLPFLGAWFVLNGGDSSDINHHHGSKAQNFAFDFTKVDSDNNPFKNEGKNNEDYFCFGEPILSPADGTVVEAVDGVKDNDPVFIRRSFTLGNCESGSRSKRAGWN